MPVVVLIALIAVTIWLFGISATDGTTVVTPSVNQYETCLRCHGNSTGKQALVIFGYLPLRAVVNGSDALNLIPQMTATAASSHPVVHDRTSALPQPSLLPYMLQLDGKTQGRAMGGSSRSSRRSTSAWSRSIGPMRSSPALVSASRRAATKT